MKTFDDVNGQIIGGDYLQGRLYYNGRGQSSSFYAANEEELRKMAEAHIEELRKECGEAFHMIWPENNWQLRIA